MEMNQIRYALAAERTLNFTNAASDCSVSQPALTKGIKALEAELGADLFHREGRRILVSEFGKTMLPVLRRIIENAEAARDLAANYRMMNRAPIRLGVMSSIGHLRLARFFATFGKEMKGVELAVSEMSLPDLRTALDNGDLDAILVNPMEGFEDRFNVRLLFSEKYIVILPPGHRLEGQNAITLHDLHGEAYVDRLSCELRETVMAVCRQKDIALDVRFRSEKEDWVQAMVNAGMGFAFMPEYAVTMTGLIQRPLVDPEVSRRIAIVTVPGRQHTPAVSAFVSASQRFAWPG